MLSVPVNSTDTHRLMMYDAAKKSAGVAYLLWFFFGLFGVHRFYLKRTGTAAGMLVLALASIPLMVILVGWVTFAFAALWAFIDLFLIPGMVREYNLTLAGSIRG